MNKEPRKENKKTQNPKKEKRGTKEMIKEGIKYEEKI